MSSNLITHFIYQKMAQKTNPTVLRLGNKVAWKSNWNEENKSHALVFFQDLETRHYIKMLFKNLNLRSSDFLVKTQNKNIFLHTKKTLRLADESKSKLKNNLSNLLVWNNSVLNVQENLYLKRKKKDLSISLSKNFTFTSANIFSEYIRDYIGASSKAQKKIFKRGLQDGILSLMRIYFKRKDQLSISGIRISCKGKWSKTATGRTQKLNLSLGKLNTQTICSFIDYSFSSTSTKFGACSVKVLISYKNKDKRF